jgi:hypothetical protein
MPIKIEEHTYFGMYLKRIGVNIMKKETGLMMFDTTQKILDTCEESKELRAKKTAFTRKSRLGAKNLLKIILHKICAPLQIEIDRFFAWVKGQPVTKQALSKARENLNPEFVRKFADDTAQLLAQDDTMPCYKGMRLIAIDGTTVALENTPELKEAFGCSGPNKDAATALASIAFGPLDHAIYDFRITRYDKDERDLAKMHVERLAELKLQGSLLLFDRGYPSAGFIAFLRERGFHFLMRSRGKWNLEADAIETQGWINIHHDEKTYSIRVMKIKLSTGDVETLVTDLKEDQLSLAEAGQLYFKCWGIEGGIDVIKSKAQLENFSGKTKHSVLQDFYATIFIVNIALASATLADEKIEEADKDKELKYKRQSNRNRALSKLRDCFFAMITEPDRNIRMHMFDKLIAQIAEHPLSIVPDRSPPRKAPRKKRFYMAKKSVV